MLYPCFIRILFLLQIIFMYCSYYLYLNSKTLCYALLGLLYLIIILHRGSFSFPSYILLFHFMKGATPMADHKTLLDIMEKTIFTLEANKNTVVSIIKNLQLEYEKKKQELLTINAQLPEVFAEVEHLSLLDKQLRQKLALASSDFSERGHRNLKDIFDYAYTIHDQLLKASENEKFLRNRRDALSIELRNSKVHIEQAEGMAQQLLVSLSYLQNGVNQLVDTPSDNTLSDESLMHYLAFYKCVENEKLRIARDLHDGPAQHIASVQMRIDFCKTIIHQDLTQGLILLDQLKYDLTTTLTDIRDILFNLNPAPLEKNGLKKSIENMLHTVFSKHHTIINFYYDLNTPDIPTALQTTIYRIVQELVHNIKKHAHANHIVLRLSGCTQFIYIHIQDNGTGFSIPEDFEVFSVHKKSYGLLNISTRVQELKGQFKVTSEKDKGTLFKIQLPLLSL